jgi:hypothetical protein
MGRSLRPEGSRTSRVCPSRGPRSGDLVVQTGDVPAGYVLRRVARGRDDLIGRLMRVLAVDEGRRSGDPETRVSLDHPLPDPRTGAQPQARWRLATSGARLYPPPVARAPMSVWHGADGAKGRRLLAGDVANDNRVAALLAWHFEPDTSGRPHLLTSAAVRAGVDVPVEPEYIVALAARLRRCGDRPADNPTRARWAGSRQCDRRRPGGLEAARLSARPQGRWVRRRLLRVGGLNTAGVLAPDCFGLRGPALG